MYSLKLVNVQFTFWVRAHLSSTEILPVALVKVCFSQMALVMSSYPSCSRSASISKFVEVKVTQQNVWMTSRVWLFVPCPNPGSSACCFCEVKTLIFTSFFPHISFLGFCSDPNVRTMFSSQFCPCDLLSLSKPMLSWRLILVFQKSLFWHFPLHPAIRTDQDLVQSLENWQIISLASEEKHTFLYYPFYSV